MKNNSKSKIWDRTRMGFWYLRIFGCHVYNGTLGLLLTAAPCEGQSLTQPSDTEIKLDKSEETSSQSLEKLTNNHHNHHHHHHHTQTHTQWAVGNVFCALVVWCVLTQWSTSSGPRILTILTILTRDLAKWRRKEEDLFDLGWTASCRSRQSASRQCPC